MSYTPKHEPTDQKSASSAPVRNERQKQKTSVIILLVILVLVAAIALLFIFWPANPIARIFGAGGNTNGYVPETQSETTNISIYYKDGIVPTTGSVHGVTVIEGGGANAADVMGRWDIDGNTYFQFDGRGKGFIHVANDKEHLHFRYSAENGVLLVDMDSDTATDMEYQYVLDGETLTITDSNGRVFVMTKVTE